MGTDSQKIGSRDQVQLLESHAVTRSIMPLLVAALMLLPVAARAQQGGENTFEARFWLDVKDSGQPAFIRDYIYLFPDGSHVAEAKALLVRLGSQPLDDGRQQPSGTAQSGDRGNDKRAAMPKPDDTANLKPSALRTPDSSGVGHGRDQVPHPKAPGLVDLSKIPSPDPAITCLDRFENAGSVGQELLCVTFLASRNYSFSRDCRSVSYGFAGISVADDIFFSAGETLLLLADTEASVQVTGGRPNCYRLAGDIPRELRKYRHLMLESWERWVSVCNIDGDCR